MPEGAPGVQYAGFADRTVAFLLDAIIVSTIYFYLFEEVVYAGQFIGPLFFAETAVTFDEPAMPVFFGSAVAAVIILVLLCWLYSAGVTSSRFGGTFGKIIMGMKVIDESGNPVSFRRATVRFLAKILSGLILCIGFFMIHFSPTKQGLHDRFAGTYVVYAKKAPVIPEGAGPTIVHALTEKAEKKEAESRQNVRKVMLWLIVFPIALIGITVFLAAVIAGFMFGMAGNVSHTYVVAVTAYQPDTSSIIITHQGGQDADQLTSLAVSINDSAPVTWDSPVLGEQREYDTGTAGRDHVVVTGTFRDGSSQVILDTWL